MESSPQPGTSTVQQSQVYSFRVVRKILKLVGATIHTYDDHGQLLCPAEQKGFKLNEQIQFYRDDEKTQPIFSIKARQIIDIAATYDIFDVQDVKLASLRRKGMSSMFVRDEWVVLNAQEQEVALIQEDSTLLGVLRRWIDFVALLMPQKFVVSMDNQKVGTIQQNKNPLTVRLQCELQAAAVQQLGQTVALAIPSMLAIIEQRQS